MITRYIGPVYDSSGYAAAARGNIISMVRAGLDITISPVSFEQQYANHGEVGQLLQTYRDCKGYWDTNLIHLTPENWPRYIQSNKYNIGYTAWETSKLPDSWIPLINMVNEVWVPSKFNEKVFRNSGVTIPIRVVPHAIGEPKLIDIENQDGNYLFYSIFQWTERKNPIGLLTAYLTEFKSDEPVTLYLKTYHMGWNDKQQNIVKTYVRELKEKLGLATYPKIQFIGNLLSDDDICRLHTIGNCLVLPHRGEGFGLVPATAMSYGKPVISTNWGGNLEFMNDMANSYLVDYVLVSVGGMPWGKYSSDQQWAEPDLNDIKSTMRYVFENREDAKNVGRIAQHDIKEQLSYETIGSLIKGLMVSNGRI